MGPRTVNRFLVILGHGTGSDVHSMCRVCRHFVYNDTRGFVQPHEHRSTRCAGSWQPGTGDISRRETRAIKRAAWRRMDVR